MIGCLRWRPIWFAAGRRDRHVRTSPGAGGQGGNRDDPYRLHCRRRPGQAWPCRQPCPAGRQRNRYQFFHDELVAKRLELLRELVPGAARVAVLVNPAIASNAETTLRDVEAAARAMGLQIRVLNASTSHEINAAFATLCASGPTRFSSTFDPFFTSRRVQLALWRRATRSPRFMRRVNFSKPAG